MNDDKNLQEIIGALKNMPQIDPPPGFHEETMAKVRIEAARQKFGRRRKLFGVGSALVAAALIMVAAFVLDFGTASQYDFPAFPAPMAAGGAYEADFATSWDARAEIEAFPEIFPIDLYANLEEQFRSDDMMAARVYFPENLPTDGIAFYTEGRFAISFEISIMTDNMANAMANVAALGADTADAPWRYGEFMRTDTRLQSPYDDLPRIFAALYELGMVTSYTAFVVDTMDMDAADAARAMESHGSVAITLIGFVEE